MTHPSRAGKIELGGVRVSLISGGGLRLDGGAMFGIIPKALWARRCPADEANRISLACNCLLVEWPGSARRALVEVGHGPKFEPKEQEIFAINPARWLLHSLHDAGVDPATITDVILSHLHFDHAGGLTRPLDEATPWVRGAPVTRTFPAARVHVQQQEFDDARANFAIMTITYREENFTPLDAGDAWRLLQGDQEVLPNIRAIRSTGHTRGHHSLLIEGRDRAVLFLGDVMPTRHHAGAPYNMAYDVLPLDNRDTKQRLLSTVAERQWILAIDHDPQAPFVHVRQSAGKFELEDATSEIQ